MTKDKDDCSVYAVAFTCNVSPEDAGYYLWMSGRNLGDGATDRQIHKAIKLTGHLSRRVQTDAKTVRAFARDANKGAYLVASQDHVVAVVDGYVCNRPAPEHSDLYRIEKVWKISLDSD